jgi:peptidyl-tRNA hydrolase, PTH1 family
MKLFVGLGNPGSKHSGNRHNVGFMAVERIAAHQSLGPWRKRFQGLAADGVLSGERVLLLKPQTYYNEAGRSVGEAARFLKLDVADLVVFHDEIDLAPGKLRVKTGGGHAGNNGLRSIISHLSADFTRVRIGVGHPGDKDKVAGYVLRDFPRADAAWLETMLDGIAAAAPRLVAGDTERFQTDVAQRLNDLAKQNRDGGGGASGDDGGRRPPSHGGSGRAQAPNTRQGERPARGGGSKPKSGQPSQQALARKSARGPARTSKPSREAATSEAETTREAGAEDQPTATALADRLKRWLAGRGSKN